MKKLFLLLVLFGVLLLIPILLSHNSSVAKNDRQESYFINQLYTQYSHAEYNIRSHEGKIKNAVPGRSGVFLVFDHLSDNLIKMADPLIESYSYTGIAVMTCERLPGLEGCITETQYNRLIENRWDFAIGFEEDFVFSQDPDEASEQLAEYIDNILSNPIITKSGIKISTVSFENIYQQYKQCFDDVLREKGINIILSTGTEEFICNKYFTSEDDLLKIPCIQFNMYYTIQSNLSNKIFDQQPVAVVSQKIETQPTDRINISLEKIHNMLQYLSEYQFKEIYIDSIYAYYYEKLEGFIGKQTEIDGFLQIIDREKVIQTDLKQQIDIEMEKIESDKLTGKEAQCNSNNFQ